MDEKQHKLEEPVVNYGKKVRIGDIAPIPLEDMEETLKARGYISHEELVERLSQYM